MSTECFRGTFKFAAAQTAATVDVCATLARLAAPLAACLRPATRQFCGENEQKLVAEATVVGVGSKI